MVTKSLFDVIGEIVNVYVDMQIASHDPFQLNRGSSAMMTMTPTMIALCAWNLSLTSHRAPSLNEKS